MKHGRTNPARSIFRSLIGYDLEIVKADGHYLYDADGVEYLDMIAQAGSVPFGHNADCIWDSINVAKQEKHGNFIQPFATQASEELASVLISCAPAGLEYVTYTNSGAETVEVAIKLSRCATQRSVILSTYNGFHGKTLGALSATGKSIYRDPFLLNTQCFEYVEYGNIEQVTSRLEQEDVAAFIVEPIQGEGGMVTPPQGYLSAVADVCKRTGTLFVLDEIQTGLGRTGRLFAAEHEGLEPDILLLAKALSGGLVPIGACLCNEKSWTLAFGSLHSSTFANNQIGCLVGLAVLERLQADDQAIVRQVETQGEYLRQRLNALVLRYPHAFTGVTGQGYMQGLQLAEWDQEQSYFMSYVSQMGQALQLVCGYLLREHRIVTFPTLNQSKTLRIEPSLTIERRELDRLIDALDVLGEVLELKDYGQLLQYVVGPVPPKATLMGSADESSLNEVSVNRKPAPGDRCLGRFTFFAHPSEVEDLVKFLPPSLHKLPDDQAERLREWLMMWSAGGSEPAAVYHIPAIYSKAGGYVEGWLVCNLLTPQMMMRLSRAERDQVAQSFVNLSKSLNADVIGLGGYSAVITKAGETIADCGLRVTSGNSLTAMISVESLKATLNTLGRRLGELSIGVVGASGSVGYLVSKSLAVHCETLTLFGNPKNAGALDTLKSIAGELYQDLLTHQQIHTGKIVERLNAIVSSESVPSALLEERSRDTWIALYDWIEQRANAIGLGIGPIRITVDLEQYLPQMNAVVSATSQGHSFIDPALLAADAVVCDSARPADVVARVSSGRDDVLVYEGGLVRFPEAIRFGVSNQANQPAGLGFACLVETIVLAMSQVDRNYSIGRRINISEAEEVYEFALNHGFEANMPIQKQPALA